MANLRDRKVDFEYEKEMLTYVVPEAKRRYKPDFKLPNGIIVEAKGQFDAATRAKMALVIEQNPDRDIRLLFMRDNKISKKSKTRYSEWCRQRKIKFHVSDQGSIPETWLTDEGS